MSVISILLSINLKDLYTEIKNMDRLMKYTFYLIFDLVLEY